MRSEQGSVLVEFTLAAFLLILLVFGGVELMRAYLTAQVLSEGARVAARDACVRDVPSGAYFPPHCGAIDLDHLVDDQKAVFEDDLDMDGDVDVDDLFLRLPAIHSALRTAMIREDREIDGEVRRLLRFPGALFQDPEADLGADLLVFTPGHDAEGTFLLSRVVGVDVSGGLVRSRIRYHYPFATLRASEASSGMLKDAIDTGAMTAGDFANVSAFPELDGTVLVHPGFDPLGLRPGRYRNAFATIEAGSAGRKEAP